MTPLCLQDAMIAEIRNLLPHFQVWGQHLPPRKQEKDYSIYPFCQVLLENGEDSANASQEIALVIAVRDPSEDMQGYRDVANVMQRIREHFCKYPEIDRRYSVEKIQWMFDDSSTYPVFVGAVLLHVSIPEIEIYSGLT